MKAARVVILGVGVAGLQAIATAKRLGAVIEASDVRPSVKEQVESLGGKFIEVSYDTPDEKEAAEGVGGYAKPMPPSWLARQQVEFGQADVAIILGANEVVNPAALTKGSPISGMPILEAYKAKTIIVNKRSMAAGYAGLDNELFYMVAN